MTPFFVQEVTGKFVVKSESEVLAVMDSRFAAEEACRQLNYEPGRNACDVFMRGRWSKAEPKEAA